MYLMGMFNVQKLTLLSNTAFRRHNMLTYLRLLLPLYSYQPIYGQCGDHIETKYPFVVQN